MDLSQQTVVVESGYEKVCARGFQGSQASSISLPSTAQFTEIGDQAFAQCPNLVELSIPPNIITVGDEICKDCPSLAKVTFTQSAYMALPYGSNMFTQPSSANSLKTIVVKGWKDFGLVEAFGVDLAVTTIDWQEEIHGEQYTSFDSSRDLILNQTRNTVTEIVVANTNAQGLTYAAIFDIQNCPNLKSLYVCH